MTGLMPHNNHHTLHECGTCQDTFVIRLTWDNLTLTMASRSKLQSPCISPWGGEGRELPYLDMAGRFCSVNPYFLDYWSNCVHILCLIMIWLTPSFYRKDQLVSITFSSRYTWTLIFHKNVLFNSFEAFCVDFLLDFQTNWPPFSLTLVHFDLSFS